MPDISIQFHSSPDEAIAFIDEMAREFSLRVVAMRFFPFGIELLRPRKIIEFLSTQAEYRRVALVQGEPALEVRQELEFADKNPGYLRIDVGRTTQRGLEQSWLTARTDNPDLLGLWRKIGRKLKRRTQAGVTAVNVATGAQATMRTYRFTEGAKKLEEEGVVILPPAGSAKLLLGRAAS